MNGEAVLQTPYLDPLFRRLCNIFLRISSDWRPRRDTDQFIHWAPRGFNTSADHLVNAAMNSCTDWSWTEHSGIAKAMSTGARLKICVDGGLRRSSEQAALGITIYHFNGAYQPLFYSASLLHGIHSPFQVEAHALVEAMEIFSNFSNNVQSEVTLTTILLIWCNEARGVITSS